MLIYLLRHGEAVSSHHPHDSERSLSELGKRQAKAVGAFCARQQIQLDAIFSSPLVRAKETAEPLRVLFPDARYSATELLVPGARITSLLEHVNGSRSDSVMLIGHEPMMSELVSVLVSGDREFKVEFEKATLACVEAVVPLQKGRGFLKWLQPANHLMHVD
ncbi:MAG: phosphohistidine phosphatase SixA [Ignavibacteriales bacterium]|nr:phosphohistidine phosphatase SixA [Ignavibacteriales bacterium]